MFQTTKEEKMTPIALPVRAKHQQVSVGSGINDYKEFIVDACGKELFTVGHASEITEYATPEQVKEYKQLPWKTFNHDEPFPYSDKIKFVIDALNSKLISRVENIQERESDEKDLL